MFIKRLLCVRVYVVSEHMPFFDFISGLETLLLGFFETRCYVRRSGEKVFQDIIVDATMVLVVIFWVLLASIVIWGVIWTRSKKR
jgi:hypothetical protein